MCMFSQFTWRKDFFLLGTYLWRFSLIFMTGFTLLCALLLFSLLIALSLCIAFYSILSNINQVLLIYPSANVFAFGDFNVHNKDWITYSGGTDRSGELSYNFSNDLTWRINVTTPIPDCDSHSPAIFDLFLSSNASICSTMAFPPLRNSDHVVVLVFIHFPSYSQWDASFHRIAYDYSGADWEGLCDHFGDVP